MPIRITEEVRRRLRVVREMEEDGQDGQSDVGLAMGWERATLTAFIWRVERNPAMDRDGLVEWLGRGWNYPISKPGLYLARSALPGLDPMADLPSQRCLSAPMGGLVSALVFLEGVYGIGRDEVDRPDYTRTTGKE